MEEAQISWLEMNGKCSPYICASFKQLAIQKDITKMKDA